MSNAMSYHFAHKIHGDARWTVEGQIYPTSAVALAAAQSLAAIMSRDLRIDFEIRDEHGSPVFNWTQPAAGGSIHRVLRIAA